MGTNRVGGPVGDSFETRFVDEGTLCLASSPPPGPLSHTPSSASVSNDPSADAQETIEELVQIALDVAGMIDPSPISDALGTANELRRGNYGGAALSALGVVPYIGDLAKAGKLGRYVRAVSRAIELARTSDRVAAAIAPFVRRLDDALSLMPSGVNIQVDQMKRAVQEFLGTPQARRLASDLPDISYTYRFGTTRRGDSVVQWSEGRLGVPGTVRLHDNPAAHRAISNRQTGSHPGDHAGHLIGRQFGAPDIGDNLAPQNYIINSRADRADTWVPSDVSRLGTFRRQEQQWAEKLRAGTGIEVRVEDVFKAGETRPFMRRATWTEIAPDGSVTNHHQVFMNPTTPTSRQLQGE
jgi:hypothetical protein